jgi:cytochrome c oxidase subunit 4
MSEITDRSMLKIRWLGYGLLWLALLVLLGITLVLAYVPLGRASVGLHLAIAAIQIALLWSFFMNLRTASTLVRITAASGILWLIFMFTLTFSDYMSRS